jgi:hypothetical protein
MSGKLELFQNPTTNAKNPGSAVKLNDRNDWHALGLRILRPIFDEIRSGRTAKIHSGSPVSTSRPGMRREEWELRSLWLAGPLLALEKTDPEVELESGEKIGVAAFIRDRLALGVDRSRSGCWLPPNPVMDQGIVEGSALAFALVTARGMLWDKMSDDTKAGIDRWFDEVIATFKRSINNWNLFPVLMHLAKWKLGLPHDWALIDGLLAEVEKMYLKDGWYADGYYRQFDYYVPWAIQTYLLIAAEWMKEERPEFRATVHERARRFSTDYAWYFDSCGRHIPYGRSLAYRFAASSFWSACAWSRVPSMDLAKCREIATRSVEWFFSRGILTNSGLLSVGYAYPNEKVVELYISDASPMWALKPFLLLAIPESDSVWQGASAAKPEESRDGQNHVRATNCILARCDEGRHAILYNGGSFHPFNFSNHPAKYGKFAYSSHFGFNVADNVQPSLDSVLSMSPDGQFWSHRHHFEILPSGEGVLISKHQPFVWDPSTLVTTALVAWGGWHVRLHWMRLARDYTVRDGAFPVPVTHCENIDDISFQWRDGFGLFTDAGCTAIFGELGESTFSLSYRQIQVNLYERVVMVPFREAKLAAGDHFWATSVFGSSQRIDPESIPAKRPRIEWSRPESATVTWPGASSISISMISPELPIQIITGGGKLWNMDLKMAE